MREAFLLEHGITQNQEIADLVGRHKSRISQIFKDTAKLEPETVRDLLSHLTEPRNRRRILRAWILEAIGEDIDRTPRSESLGHAATPKVLRRIDRQIRESRLYAAARLSMEAYSKTDDRELEEQLLDRAYFTRQRLDEASSAMAVARIIANRSVASGERRRLAAAHLYRLRILIGLADSRPDEISMIFDLIDTLLAASPPIPTPAPPYSLARETSVAFMRISSHVTFVERGVIDPNEEMLRNSVPTFLKVASTAKDYQSRYQALQTAARIHLALGETFQAQECLEKAFLSGEAKNLNVYEMSGLIQGRIAKVAEGPEAARRYLSAVRRNCVASEDRYHGRLADYDLTRIESDLFPV